MSNIALPGTSSFVGEFLILLGIFKTNIISSIFASLGVILCGSYYLWLYKSLCFGNLKNFNILIYKDINLREFIILFILFFFVILIGIYPKILLEPLQFACVKSYIVIFLI
jgi:NADH-quinone oxidoreductase subunit M